MKQITLIAAVLATVPALAQAAPVQANFTATVDAFSDDALNFGGQTAEAGDEILLSFLYDPDLAAEGWVYETPDNLFAYGGSLYDDSYDYPVPSPIISATVKVGTASYTIGAEYYGYAGLAGFLGNDGKYLTQVNFEAREQADKQLSVAQYYTSLTASPLLNPSFAGRYSFDFPGGVLGSTGFFYLGDRLQTEGVLTSINFTLTQAEIAPYNDTPQPAPVPLPAGAPLVLTGLAALFGLRRVKRRA